MFLLVAVPKEKRPKPIIAGNMDTRRPHSSDTGAQQRGPKANPNLGPERLVYMASEGGSSLHQQTYMYSEIHRTVTSCLAPVYSSIEL
jgi:hypothetical protein